MKETLKLIFKAHPIKQAFFLLWITIFLGSVVFFFFFLGKNGMTESLNLIKSFIGAKDHITLIFLYLLLFAFRNIFFISASALLILSGILFGVYEGIFWAGIGQTIGAMVGFLFSRYFGREFFQHWESPTIAMIDKKLESHGMLTIGAMRIVPFPFDGVNFAAGISRIHWKDFFWGTFLFSWPEIILYVLIGNALDGPLIVISIAIMVAVIFGGAWYFKTHPHFADLFEQNENKE